MHRSDGTGIRLHPRYGKRKMDAYDAAGHDEPAQLPAKGAGKSDGLGTFRKYAKLGNQIKPQLRFAGQVDNSIPP